MGSLKEIGLFLTLTLIATFSLRSSKLSSKEENPIKVGGMINWKL